MLEQVRAADDAGAFHPVAFKPESRKLSQPGPWERSHPPHLLERLGARAQPATALVAAVPAAEPPRFPRRSRPTRFWGPWRRSRQTRFWGP